MINLGFSILRFTKTKKVKSKEHSPMMMMMMIISGIAT